MVELFKTKTSTQQSIIPNGGVKYPTLSERIASSMMGAVRKVAGSKPVAAMEKMGQSINRGYASVVPLVTLGTAKPITPTTKYEKQVYGDTGGEPLTLTRSGAEMFGNESKLRSAMSLKERIGYPALGAAMVAADLVPGVKQVKNATTVYHGGKAQTQFLATAGLGTAGGVALDKKLSNAGEYKAPKEKPKQKEDKKTTFRLPTNPVKESIKKIDDIATAIAYNETRGEKSPYTFKRFSGVKEYGDALGKYQVTEGELKTYSERYLGKKVTAKEFMSSPKLQEKYMKNKIMYYDRLGYTPEQIADIHRMGYKNSSDPGEDEYQNEGYVKSFTPVMSLRDRIAKVNNS